MERWKDGKMEKWNNGKMGRWENGIMEKWKNGTKSGRFLYIFVSRKVLKKNDVKY